MLLVWGDRSELNFDPVQAPQVQMFQMCLRLTLLLMDAPPSSESYLRPRWHREHIGREDLEGSLTLNAIRGGDR